MIAKVEPRNVGSASTVDQSIVVARTIRIPRCFRLNVSDRDVLDFASLKITCDACRGVPSADFAHQ